MELGGVTGDPQRLLRLRTGDPQRLLRSRNRRAASIAACAACTGVDIARRLHRARVLDLMCGGWREQ